MAFIFVRNLAIDIMKSIELCPTMHVWVGLLCVYVIDSLWMCRCVHRVLLWIVRKEKTVGYLSERDKTTVMSCPGGIKWVKWLNRQWLLQWRSDSKKECVYIWVRNRLFQKWTYIEWRHHNYQSWKKCTFFFLFFSNHIFYHLCFSMVIFFDHYVGYTNKNA